MLLLYAVSLKQSDENQIHDLLIVFLYSLCTIRLQSNQIYSIWIHHNYAITNPHVYTSHFSFPSQLRDPFLDYQRIFKTTLKRWSYQLFLSLCILTINVYTKHCVYVMLMWLYIIYNVDVNTVRKKSKRYNCFSNYFVFTSAWMEVPFSKVRYKYLTLCNFRKNLGE